MKPEVWFHKRKVKPMLDRLKPCHYDRVENCVTQGMPDVRVTYNGVSLWLELKVIETEGTAIRIGAEQRNWHNEEAKAGGKAYVLTYVRDTKQMYLFRMPKISKHLPDERKLIKDSCDLAELFTL